jgi:hypothetical protein
MRAPRKDHKARSTTANHADKNPPAEIVLQRDFPPKGQAGK